MAQSDPSSQVRGFISDNAAQSQSLWRRIMSLGRDKDHGSSGASSAPAQDQSQGQGTEQDEVARPGLIRRVSRKVVPGLPRAQTFRRQQSELRTRLEPVEPTQAERRAVSMDRRLHPTVSHSSSNPRTSAPDFTSRSFSATASVASGPSPPASPVVAEKENILDRLGGLDAPIVPDVPELTEVEAEVEAEPRPPLVPHVPDAVSNIDAHSVTTSQYEAMIHDELERIWILNLSMHFRDKSKREKFFVTYREHNTEWRRVTISLDYRNAPGNSLESELVSTKFQRDKSAKIYEAIRESLPDIQFYDTVTNLKLQTTEGRLHVHVVEDVNEIINYPSVHMIHHMKCRRVKEKDLQFESHMSGFVYKVRVNDEVLIKKEIPGPDTVEEFLYEINALSRLRTARNVIEFYGVVVDDEDKNVKGLLISYAEQGALIDVIYDHNHTLPWSTRERWARQIVAGLSEIHESGFVQGDFTLSNIVVDHNGDAKIIDINRRGCPVGWEPPEATPLIESNQRISMYIGVKSDLYQLGMVLWALATQEDEPEAHGRPLRIGPDVSVPSWYHRIVDICLSGEPRLRVHALHLLSLFPEPDLDSPYGHPGLPSISVDDGYSPKECYVETGLVHGAPQVRTVHPPHDWSYLTWSHAYPANTMAEDPYYYPTRGRSPPSPLPSNHGGYDSGYGRVKPTWSDHYNDPYNDGLTAPSVSDDLPDAEDDQKTPEAEQRSGVSEARMGSTSKSGESRRERDDEGRRDCTSDTGGGGVANEQPTLVEQVVPAKDDHAPGDAFKGSTPNRPTELANMTPLVKDAKSVALEPGNEATQDRVAAESEGEAPSAGAEEVEMVTRTNAERYMEQANMEPCTDITTVLDREHLASPWPASPPDQMTIAGSEPPGSDILRDIAIPNIGGMHGSDAIRLAKEDVPLPPRRPPSAGSTKSGATPDMEMPELKGIGSAHDLAPQKRQDSIPDEDFGVPVSNESTTVTLSTTDDSKE